MAKAIVMPKLGTTMKEGTLTKWHKNIGEYVKEGDVLLSVESNKADVEVESTGSGYLVRILHEEGETIPITKTIGILADSMNEDISALLNEAPEKLRVEQSTDTIIDTKIDDNIKTGKIMATPKARVLAKKNGISLSNILGTGKEGIITDGDVSKLILSESVKATPVAKKIAEQSGLSLSGIQGSGANKKVIKEDVLRAIDINNEPLPEENVPFSGMRKAIADNMMNSVHGMAHAYHMAEVDMTEAAKLKSVLLENDRKISYSDIVVKASAKALTEYPMMNATLKEQNIIVNHDVNIGVAVAVENGLIVPNIKKAQSKSLDEISGEIKALALKAIEGNLEPEEYKCGTFTVSNLGMYGLDAFIAIINPPEVGILAVGRIKDTVVVKDRQTAIRPMMSINLTYDHRVVDGAPAAQFLMRIKQIIESPYLLI